MELPEKKGGVLLVIVYHSPPHPRVCSATQELIRYFNSIKKTQEEINITLSEIKKNLHGINSGVDEAKNQINNLEPKEEKIIQSEQQEEKRIKKRRIG